MADNIGVLICPHCHAMLTITAVMKEKAGGSSIPAGDTSAIGDLLRQIDDEALDEGELSFVTDIRARFKQWKDKIKISDKQVRWLERLAKKGF